MKTLKILYYKWIKRACPHICMLCQFKEYCNDKTQLLLDLKMYSNIE